MDWIQIIIYIFVGIVYTIVASNVRSGYNRRGRYGILGVDDFSLSMDPLAGIRGRYAERLKVYYRHNQPKQYLINKNCEARLVQYKNKMYFYCKERTNGTVSGKYFEVKGNVDHVATMWGIIDMEFNSNTNFQDVKSLYYSLNQGFETRGGLKYYNEPLFNKLPAPEVNKSAQNEYCRMEIITGPDGEKVLLCSEIWGVEKFDEPRKFIIYGDKLILYGVLSEFSNEKDKMTDYLTLLYRYAMFPGCRVKELGKANKEQKELVREKRDMPNYNENNPEPVKYLHVDFSDGVNDSVNNKENINTAKNSKTDKSDEMTPDTEQEAEINKDESQQSIEKYDERNLDL